MPLEGTIADYGLGDVLQLIAAGRRSGRLSLSGDHGAVELELCSGAVAEVTTERPRAPELGSRMVRAGLLTDASLGWALAERAESGRDLGELLLEADLVDAPTLRSQADLLRWEILLAPFTWGSGRYAFENGPPRSPPPGALPVDLLLMRGLQLVEGWGDALRRVPSRAWVVARRLPLPPPGAHDPFADATTARPGQAPLSDEAGSLHRLATPSAPVARVIDRAPFDRYGATFALAELVDAGLVVLSPP